MVCERKKGVKGDLSVSGLIPGRIEMTPTGRGASMRVRVGQNQEFGLDTLSL